VIVLDTHVWIWWVHGDSALPSDHLNFIASSTQTGIGIPSICCWEVAKLVERQRLILPCDVLAWIQQALAYPGVRLLDLTPRISVESTQLPGAFHRDPADQIIVATARVMNCPLVTLDTRILAYPHVQLSPSLP